MGVNRATARKSKRQEKRVQYSNMMMRVGKVTVIMHTWDCGTPSAGQQ